MCRLVLGRLYLRVSEETRLLAEALHHEARTERIFEIIQQHMDAAMRVAWERGYEEGKTDYEGTG